MAKVPMSLLNEFLSDLPRSRGMAIMLPTTPREQITSCTTPSRIKEVGEKRGFQLKPR